MEILKYLVLVALVIVLLLLARYVYIMFVIPFMVRTARIQKMMRERYELGIECYAEGCYEETKQCMEMIFDIQRMTNQRFETDGTTPEEFIELANKHLQLEHADNNVGIN